MLDQVSLRSYEAKCTQESPPPCRVSCPFNLDCRSFLKNLAQGRLSEARKIYERHVPLPKILSLICDHPCEEACWRRDLGGSVALQLLEKSLFAQTKSQERLWPFPPKPYAVAVLGVGLAGLVGAYDLARKSYPVTVFYESNLLEGIESYPSLSSKSDLWLNEIEELKKRQVQFKEQAFNLALLEELNSDFAGILLDVDAARILAPKREEVDQETLWYKDKICCAGFLKTTPTGHSYALASSQASEGRFAAQTLERLMAGRSLTAERHKVEAPLHTEHLDIEIKGRVEPKALDFYSQEELKAEAARCLECECLICVRQCAYLQKYQSYPKVYARQIHNNATIVKGVHTANALINGCALCGQCAELCPEKFSMAELCLAAREELFSQGLMPPSAHEFALEDMEQASGPEAFLALKDQDFLKPSYLFFPGCQLTASRGEQVIALYEWLKASLKTRDKKGLALLLSCCGEPAYWAGRKRLAISHQAKLKAFWIELGRPQVLTACASCLQAFKEGLPEIPVKSVWEVLDELDLSSLLTSLKPKENFPKIFSIQDPCQARLNPNWHRAVRSLLNKAKIKFEEPKYAKNTSACCGYGGLVWCAQADTAKAMTDQLAKNLPHPALASCIMCRDRLVASGKACWHLLDVLMPSYAQTQGLEPGPTLGERRFNRAKVKAWFTKEPLSKPGLALILEENLSLQLEAKHILLEDLEVALKAIEAQKLWFLNEMNGHRLGSFRPRKVTFWVEYTLEEEGFKVYDAWCHRMIVPGSGGEEASEVIKSQQFCTDGGRRERI